MNYRVVVPSDRTEDIVTDDLDKAWFFCIDLSVDFGYAEVRPNYCSSTILGSYTNGK